METVYFLQRAGSDEIKIGWTTRDNLNLRIGELQTGNARELIKIGTLMTEDGLGFLLEQELHKKFEIFKSKLGGSEWFNDDKNIIRNFIGQNMILKKDLEWFANNRKEQYDYIFSNIIKME